MSERTTYLLIDGENIDATLGTSILQRRPQPDERPRWKRLLGYLEDRWDQPVKGLFFLAIDGEIPIPFVQALTALGFQPIMLRGEGKVVDIGIQRTAEALLGREDDVVLVSHDEGAVTALEPERVLLLPDGVEDLWGREYEDLVALA